MRWPFNKQPAAQGRTMPLAELCCAPLAEVASLIRTGEVSPVELTEAMLARIEELDSELHAYVHVASDRARRAAQAAEAQILSGDYRGALHGIPLGIKDIFNTIDMPTANGSPEFAGRIPSKEALVVTRLNRAGAVLLGKQATAEFAFLGYNPLANPPPVNPWNADRWPGVSSGGSCVAVAGALCFGSFGTDTGGSIRYPSAANGIVGMKPTFGRISRRGIYPFAETLDHVGPLARTVRDVAILYDAVAGFDPEDPFSADVPDCDAISGIDKRIETLRLGVDLKYYEAYAVPEVVEATKQCIAKLEEAGAQVVTVDIAGIADVSNYWLTTAGIEALQHHGRERIVQEPNYYGRNVRELLEGAMSVTADDLARAASSRRRTDMLLDAAFAEIDMLILPGMGSASPPISVFAAEPDVDAGDMAATMAFSAPFNFTGHPTLSLPSALDADGMPLSVQLVARHFDEARLLRIGNTLEHMLPHVRYPRSVC